MKVNYRKVITITPITCDSEYEMIYYLKNPKEIKNYINDFKILNISQLILDNNFGINITSLNINYILSKFKKARSDSFFIQLVNEIGENANTCLITNKKIPYLYFYYNGLIKQCI